MLRNFKKLKDFDAVTRYRLINAFIIAAGMNLLYPVLADLKGEYLVAWIISAFMIIETLAVKTNRYFIDNFSLSKMYKLSIFAHINFTHKSKFIFKCCCNCKTHFFHNNTPFISLINLIKQ